MDSDPYGLRDYGVEPGESASIGIELGTLAWWAITGIILETVCPIARETMWSKHYQWERESPEWVDIGGSE